MIAEFTKKTLIDHLGPSGEDIFIRVMAKRPIDEKSSLEEVSQFIKTVENVILAISSQEKANEIALILRSKLLESKKTIEKEQAIDLKTEIEEFFKKYDIPTETDIMDYVKYLTLKYGGNAKKVEKEITDRVKASVKDAIIANRLKEEINGFLTRYPQPQQADISDFISFIRLSKLDYPEDKLTQMIEKERLYRKFHGAQQSTDATELDHLINFVKTTSDKDAIGKLMKKQGLSYLIKDENGVSYKLLAEFVELINPSEKKGTTGTPT